MIEYIELASKFSRLGLTSYEGKESVYIYDDSDIKGKNVNAIAILPLDREAVKNWLKEYNHG